MQVRDGIASAAKGTAVIKGHVRTVDGRPLRRARIFIRGAGLPNGRTASSGLEGEYEIYMVADASGGTSKEAHDYSMQRMIQAGVVPVTWQQVLLEWQRDWARKETYDAVMAVVREHSGAYGMGVDYAYTMVHKAPQRTSKAHEALAPVRA